MTRNELKQAIAKVIQSEQPLYRKVEAILEAMGRLSPERDGNIKEVIPDYNKHLIKKVGRVKMQFTPNEMANAKAILRKMGMI